MLEDNIEATKTRKCSVYVLSVQQQTRNQRPGQGRWTGKRRDSYNSQEDPRHVPSPGYHQGASYQWKTAVDQCHNCGERGHWGKDCPREKKKKNIISHVDHLLLPLTTLGLHHQM